MCHSSRLQANHVKVFSRFQILVLQYKLYPRPPKVHFKCVAGVWEQKPSRQTAIFMNKILCNWWVKLLRSLIQGGSKVPEQAVAFLSLIAIQLSDGCEVWYHGYHEVVSAFYLVRCYLLPAVRSIIENTIQKYPSYNLFTSFEIYIPISCNWRKCTLPGPNSRSSCVEKS